MNNNQSWVVEMFNKGDVAKKEASRKVWSIDLTTVLVPLMTATNAIGATNISREALGAPLRLGRDKKTNAVRFNSKGEPVFTVAKEISDTVKVMREKYVAGLVAFTNEVATSPETAEVYKAEAVACAKIGNPIKENDLAVAAIETEKRKQAIIDEAIAHAEAETVTEPVTVSEKSKKTALVNA